MSGELVYLALVSLEWESDLQYDYSLADLRAALLPHRYNEATCEVKLNDSNIVVNIWSWAKQDDAKDMLASLSIQQGTTALVAGETDCTCPVFAGCGWPSSFNT